MEESNKLFQQLADFVLSDLEDIKKETDEQRKIEKLQELNDNLQILLEH